MSQEGAECNLEVARLRQFGGSLQFESNETGTRVRAVLPQQSSFSMASKRTASW